MGHITFLVKVELMLAQGLGFSPKSSWRLSTNTLNINYKTEKKVQNQDNHLHYFVVFLDVAHANCLLKTGWKWTWSASILIMRISVVFRKLFKLIVIGLWIMHAFVSWFLKLIWISYTQLKYIFSCTLSGHMGPPTMLTSSLSWWGYFEHVVQYLMDTWCIFCVHS